MNFLLGSSPVTSQLHQVNRVLAAMTALPIDRSSIIGMTHSRHRSALIRESPYNLYPPQHHRFAHISVVKANNAKALL